MAGPIVLGLLAGASGASCFAEGGSWGPTSESESEPSSLRFAEGEDLSVSCFTIFTAKRTVCSLMFDAKMRMLLWGGRPDSTGLSGDLINLR